MGIRFTRAFSALLSTLFCTLAFSSALPDTGQSLSSSQEPLLLAVNDGKVCHTRLMFLNAQWNCENPDVNKVYVCHVKPNGKYKTKYLPEQNALKKVDKHPDQWILGKCEDVVSPS